jgi:hypothetical protein
MPTKQPANDAVNWLPSREGYLGVIVGICAVVVVMSVAAFNSVRAQSVAIPGTTNTDHSAPDYQSAKPMPLPSPSPRRRPAYPDTSRSGDRGDLSRSGSGQTLGAIGTGRQNPLVLIPPNGGTSK